MKQLHTRQQFTVYKTKVYLSVLHLVFVFVFLCYPLRASDCPPDSLSLSEKISLLSNHVQTTDESCLLTIINSFNANQNSTFDTLANLLNRWTTHHNVSSQLLCTGYNNQAVRKQTQLWDRLWRSFQTSHKSLFTEVYKLYKNGSIYTADTLLYIYDSEGKIDNNALSLWIKIKTITKDYKILPHLFCRLFNEAQYSQKRLSIPGIMPDSVYSVKMQFQQTLDESGKDNIPQILTGLKKCVLSMQGQHDAELFRWLAYQLGNYGLYDEELEVTHAIQSSDDGFSVSSELAAIARNRFINKLFVPALRAGREAFKKAQNNDNRNEAGTLIYQSFIALGLNDSALQWIKYANLTNLNNSLNAINLYQLSGQLAQAQTLIAKFPSSLIRDTLTIRQALFSQNPKTAHDLLLRSDSLIHHKNELYLWNVRVAIFNQESDNVMKLLDSIPAIPQFRNAAEVLGYKYHVLKLLDCPEALEAWALIEYNIYIGSIKTALAALEHLQGEAGCKAECALIVAQYLYERKKTADALMVLSSFDESEVSAELLYMKALFLYEQEKPIECRKILEKILLDFPDDIYSGKARIILSDLPSGQ